VTKKRESLAISIIAIGFIGMTYLSCLDLLEIRWSLYFIGFAFTGSGVILYKYDMRRKGDIEKDSNTHQELLIEILSHVISKLETLNIQKSKLSSEEICFKIDKDVHENLNRFVENRETISLRYGTKVYGEVMSLFSAGERYINRVWSASSDGYYDEMSTYLEKSLLEFQKTEQLLRNFQEKDLNADQT
jgi:hypothetical protein